MVNIAYVHNFRLSAETVSLMSNFVRIAKTRKISYLKLHDHAILFKMGSIAIATDDDQLNELFNKILVSLNLSENEIASCRQSLEDSRDDSVIEWQNQALHSRHLPH